MAIMVLSGVNAWGIEVATTYDFTTGTNGTTPTISTTAHHKAGNSTNVFLATDDICKSRFCFQAVDASNNHVFDFVNSKLQQLKGDRWFSVVDLKAGDKIAFTFTVSTGGSSTDKHFTVENAGTGTTTNLSLTKGGDAITANTDMVSGTEYYVLADGYLDFKTRKNFYLTKVVITSEVGEETVSKPELSITGANLGARTVTIKRGESSLNNTTTTYYTIDGSAPTTASTSSANQYTPVLVGEGATEEATVTVKAISVSSGNVSSEVAELAVPVGTTIQLDAPTIAVTGMALNGDVYNPVFTFTGTQSVIGKPTATLSYSIDEGAATEGASCTVTAPGTLRVTVSAEGYASNYKDFVIKNATYTLSKTIDLSASDYVDVTGFGEGSANAHWANFGTMNATIYTLPETTSLPGITLNSVTYSQFSLGLGLGFASGTRTATVNDTKEGEIGEFILYTGGSLEDAKNVSNFVEYNEGITFTVPATGTAQALKKINVYSPKVEEPAPEIVVIDGSEYIITGENIITNGSFDNGVDGWYSGNWNNASASNYTLQNEGGFDGGAYLQYSAGGAGADSNIRGKWAVENGKTYLFRCYTSGKTPTSNNLQYSKFWASADGSAETTALYQLKWGANPEQVSDTWTLNDYVFTATTDWVVFRSSWTTETKLDGFRLVEVKRYYSPESYANALTAAQETLSNDEYTIVTGEERTALATTIETYTNATADKYQEAIEALDAAKTTFVNAKAAYQALADVKLDIQMVGYDERFPYATAEKKTTAQATLTAEPTKAADATTMTAAIYKAYRQFAESHAMAEGVEGAVNMTDAITNPKAESAIAEPWKVVLGKGSGGSLVVKNSEPWTDGDDNSTHKYFDGGDWGAQAWNVALEQTISLPAGKYMLTVKSRASDELTFTLFAGNDSTGMPALGASGNLFDRGWNDASIEFVLNSDSTLAIGVNGVAESVHQWMSFSDFRLVQLEKYETPEPVDPNDYTSYIVNADLTAAEIGWNAEGTKTSDYKEGSGIVKAGNNAQFDFKQTIANLPAGKYKVTAQAAYRYSGSEADEYAAIAAGTPTKFAKLYATVGKNTVDTLVQNRYDGASETNYLGQDDGVATVNEKFVPNSSDAVKAWFAAGQYVNEVVFNIAEEGPVTIGIVKTAQPEAGDYTVIGPWTLTRLGDAEIEPEPEPTPEPGADMTKYIVNPSFENGTTGWTYEPSNDHGAKENSNGTYTMTNCDGAHLFNIWSSGNAISQKVEGLPNGTYKLKAVIATDAGQKVQLNANGKSVQIDAVDKGTGVEGELEFNVLDSTATIGAEGVNKYWYKVDNFRLTYVKGFDIAALKDIYKTALAEAQAITGNMSAEAKLALTAAIAVEVDTTDASALIAAAGTLTEAATTANASVAAYAKAKAAIDAAKAEMAATNVYTTEALEAYKAVYDAAEPKYEDGTLTDDEAKALENPTTLTGWHDATIVDNFLLSAWDTNPDFQDAPYYINTWSIEGENDGSEFKVPFFEYWTDDANSLGAKTLTATMNSLPAGDYDVTAWVRVRMKNGVEAPATGITLQANDGEAVNVAAGDQVGTSQMYLKEFTATGTVAEDGVLKIKFNVAADNNISWLSFKNVKFEKKAPVVEPIEGISYSWESPAGEPIEWGGTIAYVNGDGDRLNYQNSGYYTICLNGKKANLTDTVASANAGKMVITLDKAVAEGDTIAYTAYITKDKSATAAAYILFENGTNVNGAEFGDAANIHTNFNGVPQTDVIVVPAGAAGSKTITLTRGQTGTNLFITKLQIIEKKAAEPQNTELALVLNVERYPGMGYGVTEATVDFSEAKTFLGVEAITTDMLSIVNPDSTTISDYAPYDGWFNGEGAAETWGNNTKVCVKFFEAIAGEGKYSICDMNGADSIGATYSVKWQLAANDKKVIYTINVTFVEKPVITLTFADLTKKDEQTVALTSTLGSNYEGLTADVDIAAILAKLEVSSLNDVTIYAVQSDGSLDDNYKLGTTDGWRNAAGDWQTWGDDAYFFVKADFTKESAQIYEAGGMENKNTTADWENPASYTATYAFVKTGSTDAVVLKVTLTYTVPTGINAIATDAQKSVIFNMNGQKVNKAHKGLYIINGHKVVIK